MPTRAAAKAVSELLTPHLLDLRGRGYSIAAQKLAIRVIPHLGRHLDQRHVRDVRAVSQAHLLSFAREIVGLAPESRRAYLGAVKRFFAFLAGRKLLLGSPASDLPLPKSQRLPRRIPSEAQVRRLMNAPAHGTAVGLRDRAILELLYGAGIRRGECLRLDLTDVDLCERQLFVRNGKGKKDRLVPLVGRAVLALDVYLSEARPQLLKRSSQTALFLSRDGARLSPAQLSARLKLHARAAGVSFVSPHSLRHACATHLLRGGADVRHVQELLGHKKLETTSLYTRVEVGDLRRVLERCHPRERRRRRRP